MSNVDSSDSEDAYEMEEHDMEEEERPEDRSWNPEDYAYKGDLRMEKPHPDRPPVAPEYMRPANSGMSHNTGPKGVKADYEAAKMNLIGTRLREKVALERRIQRHALGDEKIVLKEQEEKPKKVSKLRSEDSSSDDSDLDDEAFLQYKMDRLKMMENEMPLYGSYERVDVQGIAASLKTTSEYTFTVVHLYQNWVEACVRVNFAFEDLALQFPRVQFLRVRASEAILGFKNENLPALMIYKHTKHQDTLVRITENLGNDISTLKMAHLLAQAKVLSLGDDGQEEQQ